MILEGKYPSCASSCFSHLDVIIYIEFLTYVHVCVGTVLAPCRGETQVTTATLNLSATTTAASRLSASPWPRW